MRTPTSREGRAGNTLLVSRFCRTFVESGYPILAIDANPSISPAVALDFPHTGNIISSPLIAVPYCLLNSG
jgi:hypothetical protein